MCLNTCFQFLNNILHIFTHLFTHTYFQKIQITLLKQRYQTAPYFLSSSCSKRENNWSTEKLLLQKYNKKMEVMVQEI